MTDICTYAEYFLQVTQDSAKSDFRRYNLNPRAPFILFQVYSAGYFNVFLISYSRSATPTRQSTDEISHWTKGVVLFNEKLSMPLHPPDRDALWGAATMLGVISFASIEGGTPEDVWPLNYVAGAESGWLKMCCGKLALWQLVNPERPDSIFHSLFSGKDSITQYIPPILSSINRVPASFIELYGLDKASADGNPYALPIISIAAILNNESAISTIQLYYALTSCITNEFGSLVLNKDPRALLIMAFWYSKLSMGEWWLRKRALLEGQAICLYLERYSAQNMAIQKHLKVPKILLFKDHAGMNAETQQNGQYCTI